jgi:hypothetical protein
MIIGTVSVPDGAKKVKETVLPSFSVTWMLRQVVVPLRVTCLNFDAYSVMYFNIYTHISPSSLESFDLNYHLNHLGGSRAPKWVVIEPCLRS